MNRKATMRHKAPAITRQIKFESLIFRFTDCAVLFSTPIWISRSKVCLINGEGIERAFEINYLSCTEYYWGLEIGFASLTLELLLSSFHLAEEEGV